MTSKTCYFQVYNNDTVFMSLDNRYKYKRICIWHRDDNGTVILSFIPIICCNLKTVWHLNFYMLSLVNFK